MVKINNVLSDPISVERGFMEGHPPSMPAFVMQMIPLIYHLENSVKGIMVNGKIHKVKAFADDVKLFLGSTSEIGAIYDVIEKFEGVSGLQMHRDPQRKKCQALSFGTHKTFNEWPQWITMSNQTKIVGIIFTNEQKKFEQLNTELVEKAFYATLRSSSGMRGTLFQKVYYINTYMFSKLWYVAQVVKLNDKKLNEMLKAAMKFLYSGENERPVRSLNFRSTDRGGLGLIDPPV